MSGRRAAMAVAGLTAALLWAGPGAVAAPPPPAGLTVAGGGAGWRAESGFRLTWATPSSGGGRPLAATHYRLRDPYGAIAAQGTIAWTQTEITVLATAGVPGVYRGEVWLEDAGGAFSPPAIAQLRFDDARPSPTEPLPVAEWLGRSSFPLRIRLTHPTGPPPLSGIRGYAVSLGPDAGGEPCGDSAHCDEGELTLPGGIDDDELAIASLPEGVTHLHAVAVSGAGMKSAPGGHAVLRVDTTDPEVRLGGAESDWTNRSVRLEAVAADAGAGMSPRSGGPPPFTAIRVGDGAPAIALGATVSTEVVGEGAHLVSFYARDAAGNVADGERSNGVQNREPPTTWVRIDRTPPAAAFTSGQDPADPDLLRVRVSDQLSGVRPARGWIGVRRAGSGDRFERLPAEPPAAGELRARWASDAYPHGVYEFRATAHDAAGNVTVTGRRRDGTEMKLSNPLKATTRLRAGFHRGRLKRAAPYGRRIRVAGRLTTGRSAPLPGMPVRIVERFAPGARPATRVSTVRTMPGGRFSHRLDPGPSREVELEFAGAPTLARSSSRGLELRVRGRVRLRTSSRVARVGGAPVIFRGRFFARGASAAGKAVHLQFRLPGLPWSSFRTLKTDRHGRFRYRYRFSDDDSRGARFQFRAFVPAQENWPYEPGGSRPVLVRGR